MRVWDVSSGDQLKILNGHTHYVTSVAFSSDCTYIVSGSDDASVQVWDALSGIELRVLNGHTNDVTSVITEPFSFLWTRTEDKWIITLSDTNCLMWIPHDPIIPLFFSHTQLIISCHGSISIDFQHCKIGHDWTGCYVPAQ